MTGFVGMALPPAREYSQAEVADLVRRAQDGDQKARHTLVESNLRLVMKVVWRFTGSGLDPEDLFQVGCLGLMKAVDGFDPDRGLRFSTYAVPAIIGEIRRYLRGTGPLKVSRSLQERARRIRSTQEALAKELGREPGIHELAEEMKLPPEAIVEAMESTQVPASLYAEYDEGDGNPIYLVDRVCSAEGSEARWLDVVTLRQVMETLSPRQREVIRLRFLEDLTQEDVGRRLGVSQVQVSRLEKKALKAMKAILSGE